MLEEYTRKEDGHYYDKYGNFIPKKIIEGDDYEI